MNDKTKKWSIIASALSTLSAGGAGGVAYVQGYFDSAPTAQAAPGEDASDTATAAATTNDADPTTAATDLAEGGAADAEGGATPPTRSDPFASAGVGSMAEAYGDAANTPGGADDTSYDPTYGGADGAAGEDIPSAAAAFSGIEPVGLEPPAELADPVGMTAAEMSEAGMDDTAINDAALAGLTPPVAPQAITGDPALLPIPDAGQDAYGQGAYAQTPPPANEYGSDQYGNGQYDDGRDDGGAAPATAALAAGLGAAGGALAASAIQDTNTPDVNIPDVPSENTLARDNSNPYRPRYGETPVESTTPTTTPLAAAPATPLDAGSATDSNTGVYPAESYAQPDSYTADAPSGVNSSAAEQRSFDQQASGLADPTASGTARQDEYAFTRPAAAATQPAAPLAAVTGTTGRGVYTPPATASPVAANNSANQYGAVDTSIGNTGEGFTSAGVAAAGTGIGQPGPAQLEGMQQASVSIEKRAPIDAQVGRKAVWEIFVRNTGQVTAQAVEVHDDVPRGATLTRTHPQAQTIDGRIVWSLGSLEPGEERRLEMEIVPQVEGDMGSVARVLVGTEATARATVTKPQLQIEAAVPEEVLIGSLARLVIKVSNVGTGVAHAVRLEEHVPELFGHPGGERLIYEIGDLGPKQVRELDLMLTAAKAGVTDNRLTVHATGDFTAEKTSRVEVVAPKLEVHFSGPKKRYLQREGTFTLTLNNPGTATAHDVQLAAHVPDGLEFVDANNSGYFDPTTRTVHWLLADLPPQQPAEVKLSVRAVKEGAHPLTVESTTPQGLRAELSQPIEVEGLAAVSFEVRDVRDPVEVGGRTAYEIRVVNQGSKAANNVSISALIPPTMRAIDATGPTRHTVEAGRIVFAPLPRLAPRADTTYTIEVEAVRAGDSRLRVELSSDETTTPVTRDEPTVVFSDE